ncbi:hypothetical protein HQQ80_14215 [Microbacteriaceae bacterium VKM Ac-2855]|nr:hypothetical protein [Microbacteriaceae bacterium VKM Ac-2855]
MSVGRRREEFRRAQRTIFTAQSQQDSVGTNYLGGGLSSVAVAIMAYELLYFVLFWSSFPRPWLTALAWLILICVVVATMVAIRLAGRRLTLPVYIVFLVGIALATTVDIASLVGPATAHATVTVTVGAAVAQVSMIVYREIREIVIATIVILAAQVGLFASQGPGVADTLGLRAAAVTITLAAAVIAIVIIRSFRRMVQLEVDRALVQSTTLGPQYAVGMLASEELARLDLAAERLLADVADGTLAIPLDPQRAAHAASLATQLRLHLIEGRRETWLHHAVAESEFLGPLVTVNDPQGDAGLLDQQQRDGLLSAIWLFLDESSSPSVSLHLEIGRTASGPTKAPLRKLQLPITISTTGVPRRRIDPTAWEAIDQVGHYVESSREGTVHVEIECIVDNPADR